MQIKKLLEQQGMLQLPNFLPLQQAKQLHRQISALAPKHWCLLNYPDRPCYPIKFARNRVFNVKNRSTQAQLARQRAQFCYSFYRTVDSDQYLLKRFVPQLQQQLSQQLGIEGELVDCFIAKFDQGQFIARHSDQVRGKYAFIYQLSNHWQAKDGGALVLYPQGHRFYAKILRPKFNCLTVMALSRTCYHEVALVTPNDNKQRLTISGWIK